MSIYAEIHDGSLPSARNWSDAAVPYLRNKSAFSVQTPRGNWTSVAMNWLVSGTDSETVLSPEQTVLLFEAEGKRTGATGTRADLWAGHEGNAIYCTIDTACRKNTPREILSLRWEGVAGPKK